MACLRLEKCSEFHACVHHCDEATHTSACAENEPLAVGVKPDGSVDHWARKMLPVMPAGSVVVAGVVEEGMDAHCCGGGRMLMGEKVIINIRAFMDQHAPPDRVFDAMI